MKRGGAFDWKRSDQEKAALRAPLEGRSLAPDNPERAVTKATRGRRGKRRVVVGWDLTLACGHLTFCAVHPGSLFWVQAPAAWRCIRCTSEGSS